MPSSTTSQAAWQPGDDPGRRCFAEIGDLDLECGRSLPDVVVAYETWGILNEARDNAILVEHALTGDSHVVGPAGDGHPTPGWWDGLIGDGKPIDTTRWFVIATNVLGGCQGTTGPASLAADGSAWGSRFPYLTVRDQVEAELRVADRLGIDRFALVIGGSMGGMRVLEWAVGQPGRVARALVLASAAYATADQIAWCYPQLLAIEADADFAGGDYYDTGRHPEAGLGIARRIAHVTYRSEVEMTERFGRVAQGSEQPIGGGGRFAVESYLDHHGAKLADRFDANSYLVLTRSMNSHDVGRDRGGVPAALGRICAALTIVDIDSDRVYPPRLSDEIAAHVAGSRRVSIHSPFGHDGFLIEVAAVARVVREVLADAPDPTDPAGPPDRSYGGDPVRPVR